MRDDMVWIISPLHFREGSTPLYEALQAALSNAGC
jgi:hypothetical protein